MSRESRPRLEQFRIEDGRDAIIHLVFDMPDRSMNVFSNSAIHELERFALWLNDADVRGVVIRSGKTNAFCAGADLGELGQAYDMIMAESEAERHKIAFDHFFPLSLAIRTLETSGKPVAVAIAGLALGAGCELALGAHYRVLVDSPRAALGLPESLVGLLPGGGGTQRLPRIIGLPAAWPVLLDGERLSGRAALESGLVDELVAAGEEVDAAERWILAAPDDRQPWDRANWQPIDSDMLLDQVAARRADARQRPGGHYPAPFAIVECVEQGLAQPMDDAIRNEMHIFADLIQRPEPRDMIATLFAARVEHDRLAKSGGLPKNISDAVARIKGLWAHPALAPAGFGSAPAIVEPSASYWFESMPDDQVKAAARTVLDEIVAGALSEAPNLTLEEQALADYVAVTQSGFAAFLGGPFSLARHRSNQPS